MFEGVITALVTPFRRDLLDEDALRRLVDEQIAAGVDGLVPVGTTGESPTLTNEEHIRVIEVVIEAAAKRVPVIAGTGSNSTHEAIEMSLAAKRAGADGLLLVTPYYNRPGQEHMYRHFRAIMQAASLPTVVYNVPGAHRLGPAARDDRAPRRDARAGRRQGGDRARRCARRRSIARVGQRVAVLSGDDATAFPLFALGGRGVISVVSNVAPALMSAMWDAAAAGDWNKARAAPLPAAAARRGPVRRGEPDPGEGRARDDGPDDRGDPAAALPAGGTATAPSCARSSTSSGCWRSSAWRRPVRIAVLGADGRMGRALIARRARRRRRAPCWRRRPSAPATPASARTPARVAGGEPAGVVITGALPARGVADVWIDFTTASATESVATAAAAQGVGLVVGTTGPRHARARRARRRGAAASRSSTPPTTRSASTSC